GPSKRQQTGVCLCCTCGPGSLLPLEPVKPNSLLLGKRTSWSRGGEFGIHSVTLDGWLCYTHRLPFRLAMQYDWPCTQQTHTHTRTHARTHTHTHTYSHSHSHMRTYARFLLLLAAFRRPHVKLAYKFVRTHAMRVAWIDMDMNRTRQSRQSIHTHMQQQH